MKLKRDAKFGEEFTCCFKIDIRNLTNFDPISRKSPKFSLQWAPFEQSIYIYILFELKKYRGGIFQKTEQGYKIWRRIDLSFQD